MIFDETNLDAAKDVLLQGSNCAWVVLFPHNADYLTELLSSKIKPALEKVRNLKFAAVVEPRVRMEFEKMIQSGIVSASKDLVVLQPSAMKQVGVPTGNGFGICVDSLSKWG